MKSELKKQLGSYQHLKHRADTTYQEWQRLERRKTDLRSSPCSIPKTSNKKLLDSVILELDELAEKYHQQYLQALKIHQQIEDYVASIENPLHQNIIEMRYIKNYTHRQIAEKANYSVAQIHRIVNNLTKTEKKEKMRNSNVV